MDFQISEESVSTISEHAGVSIAFEYDRVLEPTTEGSTPDGFVLEERHLVVSQVKDYDAIDGEGPSNWPHRFDLSNWGFIVARSDGHRVGGAVIAFDSPGVDMLDGRRDLAVLWDIRISPAFRGHGLGAALFRAAEKWSADRGCIQLKVETQNTNLAACRFYERQGCRLVAVNRLAYLSLPNEIQMLWYKDLQE